MKNGYSIELVNGRIDITIKNKPGIKYGIAADVVDNPQILARQLVKGARSFQVIRRSDRRLVIYNFSSKGVETVKSYDLDPSVNTSWINTHARIDKPAGKNTKPYRILDQTEREIRLIDPLTGRLLDTHNCFEGIGSVENSKLSLVKDPFSNYANNIFTYQKGNILNIVSIEKDGFKLIGAFDDLGGRCVGAFFDGAGNSVYLIAKNSLYFYNLEFSDVGKLFVHSEVQAIHPLSRGVFADLKSMSITGGLKEVSSYPTEATPIVVVNTRAGQPLYFYSIRWNDYVGLTEAQ